MDAMTDRLQTTPDSQKTKALDENAETKTLRDKTKVTKRHAGIVAKLADRFGRQAQNDADVDVPFDEAIEGAILECCCKSESQRRSLLDKDHLFIAGDGTKVPAHNVATEKRSVSVKKR